MSNQGAEIASVLGLTYSAEQFFQLQTESASRPSNVDLIIGNGIGAVPAIVESLRQQKKVIIIEKEKSPGGKLRNVATEKHHLLTGTTEILRASTHPDVFSFFNTPVSLHPGQDGIPLGTLVEKFNPSQVHLATGTVENHLNIPGRPIDYDSYANHGYAYTLSRLVNDHIGKGERLGTLDLKFNPDSDTVLIIGVGLVGLEDLPAALLAWQIDRLLMTRGIEVPLDFDYFKFTSKPIKFLKEMFNTITARNDESGRKMIQLFGEGFGNLKDTQHELVADILHKAGIKETIVAYRGTEADILSKPRTTIKAGALKAFPNTRKYHLLLETKINSLKTDGDLITEIELAGPNSSKTIKPAFIVHAIGGSAPKIEIYGESLDLEGPLIRNGVLFTQMGNVIAQIGNMESAKEQSILRLEQISSVTHEAKIVAPEQFIAALEWMSTQSYVPAYPALAVAQNFPFLRLQKWGWA